MYYKRIHELREDNDKTQKEIAELLNTTQQHYSRIENGTTEITADRIIILAKFYFLFKLNYYGPVCTPIFPLSLSCLFFFLI